MISERPNRKLSAILSADVKNYSRLMGEDELTTVQNLKTYRQVIIEKIQQHRGRVVDFPGDNILAEFASVVDAVACAVTIQRELKDKNSELPENRRMEFRIGVNLGDVIEDEGRIYGDGVNITARLESLAEPGGVLISGTAYDHVGRKLPLGFKYLGEQSVKNIEKPIRVYRVLMEPGTAEKIFNKRKNRLRRLALASGAAAFLVGIAAILAWNFYFRHASIIDKSSLTDRTALLSERTASIAVLPFHNLSGDPEQEYFSDGITNDITTDLSRFKELFVIASNTAFTYKGKPARVKLVGQELGVHYVLEGSVQKVGDRVRVNVQLIDAQTERHLWAERYDRNLTDLLAVQDEIIKTIVQRLAIKIGQMERERAARKETANLKAYDYKLRAMELYLHRKRLPNRQARHMFEKAIELDPRYASAYVGLAKTYLGDFHYGWTEFPDQALQKAYDLAQKALYINDSLASAHAILGEVYNRRQQYDLAISELNRAIELNPNDTESYSLLGMVNLYLGRTDEAIKLFEVSMRFDPHATPGTSMNLGLAYYLKGRYQEAITVLKQGLARHPKFVGTRIALAAAYARAGRYAEAKKEAAAVMRLHPFFELDSYGTVFRNPTDRADIIEGLRTAGLK